MYFPHYRPPFVEPSLCERFIGLSVRLSVLAAEEQIELTPFHSRYLPHFSSLPLAEQTYVLKQLEALLAICHEMHARGEKMRSVKSLTWAFMKHFQCTGPSDLIEHLNDDDLLNAYNTEHKLLFASFNFFEVFSYSLEDFYCRSWIELFQRDKPEAQVALVDLADGLLAGKYSGVTPMTSVPRHRCEEATSDQRVAIDLNSQICAPIYNKRQVIGFLGTHKYTILNAKKATDLNAEFFAQPNF